MHEENIGLKTVCIENEFNKAYSYIKVLYNAITSEAPSLSDLEIEHQLYVALESLEKFKIQLTEFYDYITYKFENTNN